MNKAIIITAALLVASPALATGSSHGAMKYAPGHQKNTSAGPGHSESAPGKRAKSSSTMTTGANIKAKSGSAMTTGANTKAKAHSTTTTGSNTGQKY